MLDRTDVSSPVERDQALAEVAPILAGMEEGASQSELVRRVADRLDLEPAMVMGRVVASTPATGGPGRVRRAAADIGIAADRPAPPRPAGRRSARRADLARTPRAGAAGDVHRAPRARAPATWSGWGRATSRASGQAAADFLRAHPKDPAEHLPRENGALAALITELVMMAREEPASEEAMELNFLLLDQRRLEDEIAAAGDRGDYERRATPQPRAGRAGRTDRPRATGQRG